MQIVQKSQQQKTFPSNGNNLLPKFVVVADENSKKKKISLKLEQQQKQQSAELSSPSFRIPIFKSGTRFVMLALSLACLTILSSNSLLLNFTVICMKRDNNTDFSSTLQGVLIAGTALGGIAAIAVLPPLIDAFGIRLTLSTCGVISGVVTTAAPALFSFGGFWALLSTRLVQGFCLMPAMPAISKITLHWASGAVGSRSSEHALFITLLSLYMQLGIIVTMPVSGFLCECTELGWPAAYYLFGLLCTFLFVAFLALYRDRPEQSPFISRRETQKIVLFSSQQKSGAENCRVPYAKMLSDRAVWACICAAIGSGLAYWLFAQYGPLYMNEVLNYNVDSTGVWIAVPYFLSIFSKLLVPLLERFPCLSLRFRIVGVTFLCQMINVACYLVLGFWPSASHLLAQTALIVVLSANGAGFVGLASNSQVIAGQHAHFILSLVALINYIITLVQPLIIAWMASSKDQTELASDWSRVLFAYGGISLILNVFFFCGAGTEPRPWTRGGSPSPHPSSSPSSDRNTFGTTLRSLEKGAPAALEKVEKF